MSVQQMDAWKNLAVGLIPPVVLLATAITIMARQRSWCTIILVAAAALAVLLPVVSQFLVHDLLGLAARISALPTQQEQKEALAANKPHTDAYNYYRSMLGQATYMANLVFAVALLMWVRPALTGQATENPSSARLAQSPPDQKRPD
jgi:hypothetical protein